jgi:Holliday junction resolvase-like predicted endonuclease
MNFTLVAPDHVVIDSRSVAIDTRESGGEVDIILVMPSTIVLFIQISNRVAAKARLTARIPE